jgi:aminoglycoside phosphotransferase family enzyme
MKKEEIKMLVEKCLLPDSCANSSLIETHISWIILTDHYAFKIKRPVNYSFLDFSSLEKRKHYCERELELNSRTAPEMYLEVVPITKNNTSKPRDGDILDYAVKMKRMDNDLEMDRLLEKGEVTDKYLKNLAAKIAAFHRESRLVKDPFNTTGFQDNYADILHISDYIQENFGDACLDSVRNCVEQSNLYLNTNRDYMNQRIIEGYRRDCHGDLKAANIFLYEDPVIFDCIEFNDEFRYLDIYNDIAFICVDIDNFGNSSQSELFFRHYLEELDITETEESRALFNYYKSYRANIKAKVGVLRDRNTGDGSKIREQVKRNLDLMEHYSKGY